MGSVMRYYSMTAIVVITFVLTNDVITETVPKFCNTNRFDAVFNFGHKLVVKSDDWLWTYDGSRDEVIEPPVKESNFGFKDTTLKTSVFIDSTPDCPANRDQQYCSQITKAMNLIFLRQMDKKTSIESTVVLKVDVSDAMTPVLPTDYPWNMTQSGDLWPVEWSQIQFSPRPSVFYPKTYEVLFIIFPGVKAKSQLLYNDISTTDWFKRLQRSKLSSSVDFIGMFYLNNKVLAVGVDPSDTTRETRIYELNDNVRPYVFEDPKRTLHKLFGCNNSNQLTTDNTIGSTKSQISAENQSKSVESSSGATIIIVVVIIFIIMITICIIAYIYVKSRGNTGPSGGRKISEQQSKALNQTSIATRLESIETIHSTTGLKHK